MGSAISRFIPLVIIASDLFLSACSAPTPSFSNSTKPYSLEVVDVFSAGYGGITEKYVEAVNIETIAIEGIKGLSTIDPAIVVLKDQKMIRLNFSGKEIAAIPYPKTATAYGWARVTVDLATRASIHSREIRTASPEKLYEAVFDSALSELDVFSRYAGADEARQNRARRDGFGGIGIRFSIKSGRVSIVQVIRDTPAAKGGLKVDDQITRIDNQSIGNKNKDLVTRLRGPIGSKVTLTVFRPSEERSLNILLEREHIIPSTVTAKLRDKVLYLQISNFNQGTANSVSRKIEFNKTTSPGGLKGIVIDLRGNPGGLLKQSIRVADLMLTHGQILSTRGRHPDSLHYYEAGGRDLTDGLPVVVIIDGKSASASEIVAAALQDHDRAIIIGTSSFGKGSVQTVIRLPNEGEITLTWSRFITPSGYALHGLGVRPTICTSQVQNGLKTIIHRALKKKLTIRSTFASWRMSDIQHRKQRKALRETCPSERRKGDTDIRIAKYLLHDHALFTRTLDISAATAEAHN